MWGVFLCLWLVSACDRSPREAALSLRNPYYNQLVTAEEALEEWEFQEAINAYTEVLDQQPENAEVYARRGYAHWQNEQEQLALQDYNRALELNASLARAYAGLALYHAFLPDQQQQAEYNIQKALVAAPNAADIYAILGRAYYQLKEYEKALGMYQGALERDAGLIQAYSGRGLVYTALGDYQQALADFDAALEIRPNYLLYNNRAVLFDQLGHYDQAITNFHRAIALNPEFALGFANLGLAYIAMWNFESAETQCQQSLDLDEYNCAAHYCLGRIYKASNEIALLEQALRHYTQVLEYGCEYFNENYIANALILRGQVKTALEFPVEEVLDDFQAAIRYDPNHTYAYMVLGEYYEEEKALSYYTMAIQLTPEYAPAYLKRGQIYKARDQLRLALSDFQQASQLAIDAAWEQQAEAQIQEVQAALQISVEQFSPVQMAPPVPSPTPQESPPPDQLPVQRSRDTPAQTKQDLPTYMLEDIR